jgi:hypothetical protein
MPIVESTARRMVLASGSTRLTLDKDAGKAILQRKFLLWDKRPVEMPLTDISSIALDKAVDRASGVEIFHVMLVTRAGAAWALPVDDKAEAERNIAALREFLVLPS